MYFKRNRKIRHKIKAGFWRKPIRKKKKSKGLNQKKKRKQKGGFLISFDEIWG